MHRIGVLSNQRQDDDDWLRNHTIHWWILSKLQNSRSTGVCKGGRLIHLQIVIMYRDDPIWFGDTGSANLLNFIPQTYNHKLNSWWGWSRKVAGGEDNVVWLESTCLNFNFFNNMARVNICCLIAKVLHKTKHLKCDTLWVISVYLQMKYWGHELISLWPEGTHSSCHLWYPDACDQRAHIVHVTCYIQTCHS